MAFHVKTDFCGLVSATSPTGTGSTPCLIIRDDQPNLSTEKYQPNGQNGAFIATEVYGEDSAPSNSYGVKKKIEASDGTIKLGKITSFTSGSGSSAVTSNYALEKVSISTGGAQIVTFSASSQQVEDDCDPAKMSYFNVPSFTLDKAQVAQDIFGALSLSGSGCEFTKLDYEFSCRVSKDKVEGTRITSDVDSGVITISGTILQTGLTAPTLAISSSSQDEWVITQKPNCKTPEAQYKEYSFEVQLILEKITPSTNNGGGSST